MYTFVYNVFASLICKSLTNVALRVTPVLGYLQKYTFNLNLRLIFNLPTTDNAQLLPKRVSTYLQRDRQTDMNTYTHTHTHTHTDSRIQRGDWTIGDLQLSTSCQAPSYLYCCHTAMSLSPYNWIWRHSHRVARPSLCNVYVCVCVCVCRCVYVYVSGGGISLMVTNTCWC